MEHPEQQHPHSGHEHHQANRMDRPSPMNMLWGMILALLTFLLILIVIVSIRFLPGNEPDSPGEDKPPVAQPEAPVMLPGGTTQWSPDDPEATITFVSSAELKDFLNVTVNDVVLDGKWYYLSLGSTSVTLKAEYLATLTPGDYRIGIHSENGEAKGEFQIKETSGSGPVGPTKPSYIMSLNENTALIPKKSIENKIAGIFSNYAILVDLDTNTIVAQRQESVRIYPASMTKVLTLLVASELLSDQQLNEYVTISAEVVTAMQQANASGVGFEVGEDVRVRDLLYAIALESDGVASIEIARYLCGSEAAFVEKMNEKCTELGLIGSHFVNVTGLDDENQYTTCREMASIMAAALDNQRVYQLLSYKEPHTFSTNKFTNRVFQSTYFNDTIESADTAGVPTRPSSGMVIAAKTGYDTKAGYCLVTYLESNSGKRYIAVTADAAVRWFTAEDYTYIYNNYAR